MYLQDLKFLRFTKITSDSNASMIHIIFSKEGRSRAANIDP